MNHTFEPAGTAMPNYLTDHYRWAYTTSKAVKFWDRRWLVNTILWGNYQRLVSAALDRLGTTVQGHCLQVACVYGDLTNQLLARLAPEASLQLVDIAPVQLANMANKATDPRLQLLQQDSSQLQFADDCFDATLLFFLLHEQPENIRQRTLRETWRVTRPGGKVVIVDYCQPSRWHPLYWVMKGIFRWLEPFAINFWQQPLNSQLPDPVKTFERQTLFGGLYQVVTITKAEGLPAIAWWH